MQYLLQYNDNAVFVVAHFVFLFFCALTTSRCRAFQHNFVISVLFLVTMIKPPKNLSNSLNESNDFSSQQNKNTENIISCKYYDREKIQCFNNLTHKDALSLFHINTCSLPKNI